MKKNILSWLIVLCAIPSLFAATQVEIVPVHSTKMNVDIANTVVLPLDYVESKKYPVVYLLHGHGGNNNDWINIVPQIKLLATQHQIILVTPNGGNSWYLDSSVNPKSQYESYIIDDLIEAIDTRYSTYGIKQYRAITGLSMGGHGAMMLAMKHKDKFSIAGSMSGVLDLKASQQQTNLVELMGDRATNEAVWQANTAFYLADNLKNGELNLIFDCGVDDYLYNCNVALHEKMLAKKIAHDFTSRPGVHNWDYWTNAVYYQLLYISRCFAATFATFEPDGVVFFRDSKWDEWHDSSWAYATAPSTLPYIMPKTKFPITTQFVKSGKNALVLTWNSKSGGDWGACIAGNSWPNFNFNKAKEVLFWIYSPVAIAKEKLPFVCFENSGSQKTAYVKLGDVLRGDLLADTWTQVVLPIADLNAASSATYNFGSVKSLFFMQDQADGEDHTLYIDEITLLNDPNYRPAPITFFTDSPDNTYFDPSWLNQSGGSTIEQPAGRSSKVPVSAEYKQEGNNALKLNWSSEAGGLWVAHIASLGWMNWDITDMRELTFYLYAPIAIPSSDLPRLYLQEKNNANSGSVMMGDYLAAGIPAETWTKVTVPVADIMAASPSFTAWGQIKCVCFGQNNGSNTAYTLYVDNIGFTFESQSSGVQNTPFSKNIAVVYNKGNLSVNGIEGGFRVVDLQGRTLYAQKQNNRKEYNLHLSQGGYCIQSEEGSNKFVVR